MNQTSTGILCMINKNNITLLHDQPKLVDKFATA